MSLIEIMVALVVGLILLAGLGSIFIQSSRTNAQDINVSTMIDDLGSATARLKSDIEMAGYWGRVHDPALVDTAGAPALAPDCGPSGTAWTFGSLTPLGLVDNVSGSEATDAHGCLPAGAVREGTDVISVRRVGGRRAASLEAGQVYLRTSAQGGSLFLSAGGPATSNPSGADWAFQSSIYFVRTYQDSPTENPLVPTLCRQSLQPSGGAPVYVTQCLASGVENLQMELGVDDDQDGIADYFTSAPGAAELSRGVAARLYVLARSTRPDVHYVNEKTYLIGNAPAFKPSGTDVRYYRKTLTTEIVLRNPRSLFGVGVTPGA